MKTQNTLRGVAVAVCFLHMTTANLWAEGGTFPATPFNGLQIDYAIVGGLFTENPKDVGDFTTSRTWTNGTLLNVSGPGYVAVSGNARGGNGYYTDVSVTVQVGNIQSNQSFRFNVDQADHPFNVRVNIPSGAQTANVTIRLTGHYNAGTRGLVVSATMPKAEGGGGPFADAVRLSGNWRYLSWLGYFADMGGGWIYHSQFGFIYYSGSSANNLWLWINDQGEWWWINKSSYPNMYRARDNAWLYYQRNFNASVNSRRYFYNYTTRQWIYY
jgi:hypothetical protein